MSDITKIESELDRLFDNFIEDVFTSYNIDFDDADSIAEARRVLRHFDPEDAFFNALADDPDFDQDLLS